MNNLEDIVQIALAAHDKSFMTTAYRNDFELELRRLLMQTELKPTGPLKRDGEASFTVRASPTSTWTTTQTRDMSVQSNTINKEILHG